MATARLWMALGLAGVAACGGGQRVDDEPPLLLADPDDCVCTVATDPVGPRGSVAEAAPAPALDAPATAAGQPGPDAATIAARYASGDAPDRTPAWTGRRIDLDLKDADLDNVFRLLSDVGNINIVVADDVTGTITLRMKDVPWDQALDAVIRSEGLAVARNGRVLLVRSRP